MNRDDNYYIWNGGLREATLLIAVEISQDSKMYVPFKHLEIKDGDILMIDYGKCMELQTLKGTLIQQEFPNGRATLCGIEAQFILNSDDQLKINKIDNINSFSHNITTQSIRMNKEINEFKQVFIEYELERRKYNTTRNIEKNTPKKGVFNKIENMLKPKFN